MIFFTALLLPNAKAVGNSPLASGLYIYPFIFSVKEIQAINPLYRLSDSFYSLVLNFPFSYIYDRDVMRSFFHL
jgi:hypothetical protein